MEKNLEETNFKYSFLKKELAQDVHKFIKSNYQDLQYPESLTYNPDKQIIEGSNVFYLVAVNHYFRNNKSDLRTASPYELEQILITNSRMLNSHYEISALVLRDTKGPNKYLAQGLVNQVKSKNFDIKFPLMIPLKGLALRKDYNSPYNYSFLLTNESEIIYSDKLKHENDEKKFDETDKNGLPFFNNKGKRIFWTANSDLTVFSLGLDLNLASFEDRFDGSGPHGRIVLVEPKL